MKKKDKLREEFRKDVLVLLRANFDYFFDTNLQAYGKGELEVKCEVVADLIVALSEQALQAERERVVETVDEMINNNMRDTSEALAYRTALIELIDLLKYEP